MSTCGPAHGEPRGQSLRGSMRVTSEIGTYVDVHLRQAEGQPNVLRGEFKLSKYAKSGSWSTNQIALEDGTVVDSSLDRGTPLEITLLPGEIDVPGLAQGLMGMRVLSRRRLLVPPELAYGEEGLPPLVPPNSTLVIDLELLLVNGASGS